MLSILVYLMLLGSGCYLGYQVGRLRMFHRETRDAYRRGKIDGLNTAADLLDRINAEGGESC